LHFAARAVDTSGDFEGVTAKWPALPSITVRCARCLTFELVPPRK
jgi:hypothetical protein